MKTLELKVPPVLQVIIIAAAMYGVSKLFPELTFTLTGSQWLASMFVIIGLIIIMMGVLEFKKAQTTVNPHTPEKSASLVISGIYKLTRNPMYLGMLFILLGWAFYLSNAVSFILLPVFIIYISRFQIKPEERFIMHKFGDEYRAYMNTVRRWL